MKMLISILLLSLSCSVGAQKSIFVRVYDLTGSKLIKGRVFSVTDTSLQLEGSGFNIPVRNIGFIKTKRSAGNNVLIGSLIGLASMAIVGAASSDPNAAFLAYSADEGAAAGAVFGLPIGAAIGGLTILFKNSRYFPINGDVTKWKAFQGIINEKNKPLN